MPGPNFLATWLMDHGLTGTSLRYLFFFHQILITETSENLKNGLSFKNSTNGPGLYSNIREN